MPITYSERITIAMGMSASQARLLTITGKLTDNELRSQTITNSKLRLAQKSSEASQAYMDALNTEKLTYKYYNDNGESASYNLTPALIYSYEPLKNQYSIQNASGQNLVSATDANHFENSTTLSEFLESYGLTEISQDYEKFLADMDAYNEKLNQYNIDKAKYDADMVEYNKKYADYLVKYEKWKNSASTTDLYAIFSGAVGTSDIKDGPELTGSKGCYWHALNPVDQNSASCYAHVLGHIIDYDPSTNSYGNNGNNGIYKTSAGEEYVIKGSGTGYMGGTCTTEMGQVSDGINEKDADGNYIRKCDGTDDYQKISGVKNKLEKAKADYEAGTISATEYKLNKLLSDFIDNGDGTYSIKSLKQKAIDLMYVSKNWGPAINSGTPPVEDGEFPESMLSRDTMVDMLINFTDGDMRNLTVLEEPEKPEMPEKPVSPVKPDKPQFEFTVNDKDKGQWYINLWYMMNGSETANKIKQNVDDDGNTIFTVEDTDKNKKTKNYKVIEDQLLTSNEWLTFALKNGIVTLKQASYFNPATDSGKVAELNSEGYFWNSTAYSSTTDIVSVEDEVAIAKAEVKYKNTTTEIENQDKKYDQDLKKLDSEHNALQTEYESLKSVIDKNVERSFKAFS